MGLYSKKKNFQADLEQESFDDMFKHCLRIIVQPKNTHCPFKSLYFDTILKFYPFVRKNFVII